MVEGEVYLLIYSIHVVGRALFRNLYAGSADLIISGVKNVVITETATIIGYTLGLKTSKLIPRAAIMNANSPTCARENAPETDVFNGCPEAMKPKHEKMTLPIITIKVMTRIGFAYVMNISGLTIIPTETKKTAPKKSFSGWRFFSIRPITSVSARIDPMIKAPRAEEKPDAVANKTIPKHIPMVISKSISSLSKG